MKINATQLGAVEVRRTFSWVDLVVLLGVFGLAWTILHFGQGMIVHFDESQSTEISTNILNIPYYAGRTVLRMWVVFGFSLLFTLLLDTWLPKTVSRGLLFCRRWTSCNPFLSLDFYRSRLRDLWLSFREACLGSNVRASSRFLRARYGI
jgi:hypothetical protein